MKGEEDEISDSKIISNLFTCSKIKRRLASARRVVHTSVVGTWVGCARWQTSFAFSFLFCEYYSGYQPEKILHTICCVIA